jgi:hypothetical protein
VERRRAGFAELAELRFLLAWRRLRSRRGVAEGIAQIALFVLALPASVVFAILIASGSFRVARHGHGLSASLALGAMLFGLWQAWTAVSLTVNERDALDVRRLLQYPVPPGRLYLLGLLASLIADPFSLFWLVLLSGVPIGAVLGRPGAWVLLLMAALAAFAAATVTLIALTQELLARLVRRRRWRELATIAAVVGWGFLIATSAGGAHSLRGLLPNLGRLR